MTFLFVAGTPRSGGGSITSSFDSHPNVLVWPFHFKYFPFFRIISKHKKIANVHVLNKALLEVFRDVFSNIVMQRDLKMPVGVHKNGFVDDQRLHVGGFSFEKFKKELMMQQEEDVDAFNYLEIIFQAFKSANSDYSGVEIDYYMMNLTSGRGLDWDNKKTLSKHKIIFPYRDEKYSYLSLKSRYFKKFPKYNLRRSFSPFSEKGLLYWLEHYSRLSKISESRKGHSNFIVVPFTELQSSPNNILKSLCSKLSLPWKESMNSLSILGVPYGGNANQEDLNCGQISNKPSKPLVPLCSFEEWLFDHLKLFKSFEGMKNERKDRMQGSFAIAFRSAFFETDRSNITRGQRNNIFLTVTGRLSIFASMLIIRSLLYKPQLIRAVLIRNNAHMDEMSFWD